jgi:hypothetical protein
LADLARRREQTVAEAVVARAAAADQRVHAGAVGERRRQRHEHHGAAAVAAHEAVGARVERLALTVRREHAALRERDALLGIEHQVDAADKRHRALAQPQALTGEVHRDQRRRAAGVDGQARAAQVERERDAAGHQAAPRARHAVDIGVDAIGVLVALPVARPATDVDAGGVPAQRLLAHARVVERVGCDLQHQALLRIEARGFARRDPKILGVEAEHVFEEAAAARDQLAARARPRIVEALDVEALLGDLADRVLLVHEQLPKLARAARARVAAADADDRDRFMRGACVRKRLRPFVGMHVGDSVVRCDSQTDNSADARASSRRGRMLRTTSATCSTYGSNTRLK